MKVKELILKLEKLDQNIEIVCYTEEENSPNVFEIETVEKVNCEKCRTKNGKPSLKFIKTFSSAKMALLNITSDF